VFLVNVNGCLVGRCYRSSMHWLLPLADHLASRRNAFSHRNWNWTRWASHTKATFDNAVMGSMVPNIDV